MKTILVVDDNFDNRYIISQMLRINGYTVLMATTGRDALAQLETQRPDLILMDMAMPEVDGWNATAQIKADPRLLNIPVVAVTGHATSDEIGRALAAGCQDYIIKPIDYEQLIAKVRTNLIENRTTEPLNC